MDDRVETRREIISRWFFTAMGALMWAVWIHALHRHFDGVGLFLCLLITGSVIGLWRVRPSSAGEKQT